MLQVVNKNVKLAENLDRTADMMFSSAPAEDMGLQQYRHPIQVEVGGLVGFYQPDGGNYFQGQANQVDQFIVAPQPILCVISATELARRISAGGGDVTIGNWVSKMIAKVKDKTAHTRNAYLQQYNNGVLATVASTYTSGTVIPLVTPSFGGRLLDKLGQYQVTDASLNVLGTVNIVDINKNSVGGVDTATIDVAPGSLAAGSFFIPIGLATGNPICVNGLQYIISPSTSLEYCGVSRANSYVQSPAFNANGAFLTLGAVDAFMTRMIQALGTERYSERNRNVWYTHPAQRMSANVLGFAKTLYMAAGGETPKTYDISTDRRKKYTIAGFDVEEDSMAATDKLYFIDKGCMRRVRYPGSQKFIPGMQEGIFWPRNSGGLWNSESDAYFQDSVNYYSDLPWSSGLLYSLGVQPALSN